MNPVRLQKTIVNRVAVEACREFQTLIGIRRLNCFLRSRPKQHLEGIGMNPVRLHKVTVNHGTVEASTVYQTLTNTRKLSGV